jgi:DNA polymerase/3'-5' exonuclease PolX
MSAGDRLPLAEARHIAGRIYGQLDPSCERLTIAGSIRRRKADIGDIELVAVPRYREEDASLWGDTRRVSVLDDALAIEERDHRLERISGGERYMKLRDTRSGLQVDLFITTREQYGLILLIRTGPATYSQWLVTYARRQGFHIAGGRLHNGLGIPGRDDCHCERIPTPEESDVYYHLGLMYAEPWERKL